MLKSRPKILLADDHPVMLAGLRHLLAQEHEVVDTVTDGPALLAAAKRWQPDLVITDVEMPGFDGIEATRRIQAVLPDVKILILSIHTETSCVHAAFEAGASGYLHKTSASEEIERAVREVLANRFYVSPAVARAAVVTVPPGESRPPALAEELEELTARELDIVRLVAEGLGNQQIAQQLGVAVTTVRTHLSSVYEKLRLETRVELALYAAQKGRRAG